MEKYVDNVNNHYKKNVKNTGKRSGYKDLQPIVFTKQKQNKWSHMYIKNIVFSWIVENYECKKQRVFNRFFTKC